MILILLLIAAVLLGWVTLKTAAIILLVLLLIPLAIFLFGSAAVAGTVLTGGVLSRKIRNRR